MIDRLYIPGYCILACNELSKNTKLHSQIPCVISMEIGDSNLEHSLLFDYNQSVNSISRRDLHCTCIIFHCIYVDDVH